jgi:hypothetical protein
LAPGRSPVGYRDYSTSDLARIHNIRVLLETGFMLADIVTFDVFLDARFPSGSALAPAPAEPPSSAASGG